MKEIDNSYAPKLKLFIGIIVNTTVWEGEIISFENYVVLVCIQISSHYTYPISRETLVYFPPYLSHVIKFLPNPIFSNPSNLITKVPPKVKTEHHYNRITSQKEKNIIHKQNSFHSPVSSSARDFQPSQRCAVPHCIL